LGQLVERSALDEGALIFLLNEKIN